MSSFSSDNCDKIASSKKGLPPERGVYTSFVLQKDLRQIFSVDTDKIEKALDRLPPAAPVQVAVGQLSLEEVEDILQEEEITYIVQKTPSGKRRAFVEPSLLERAERALLPPAKEPEKELPDGAPRVLGLVGFLRAGKDEVADYLQASRQGVFRMAFSDPIISECNHFLRSLGHTIVEANKDSYRILLQEWSMARRQEKETYWSDLLRQEIEGALQKNRMVVLSGARLPADVQLIDEYGGELWRVIRPGGRRSDHPNEAWIEQIVCQATIENSVEGDLSPLYIQVEEILRQYSR